MLRAELEEHPLDFSQDAVGIGLLGMRDLLLGLVEFPLEQSYMVMTLNGGCKQKNKNYGDNG
jgi:hypothetical protein